MAESVRIVKGTIPVAISVSHAAPHIRPGYVRDYPKPAEAYTDLIAHSIRNATGSWMIIPQELQDLDPNWYAEAPYKASVDEAIAQSDAKLLLDIHGAPSTRTSDVDYDYWDDPNGINRTQEYLLLDSFRRHGFSEDEIRRYDAHIKNPSTVAGHATTQHNIPAFQIEVDYGFRRKGHPRHDNMISALVDFIERSTLE